jgi:hypothetical protein
LTRGGGFVARAEDLNRLVSPLFSLARSLFERRPSRGPSHRGGHGESKDESAAS